MVDRDPAAGVRPTTGGEHGFRRVVGAMGLGSVGVSELFREHYDPLRRFAFLLLQDRGRAEDVVMTVFVKAFARWPSFSKVQEPPTYLRKMVLNECRSQSRQRAVESRANGLVYSDQKANPAPQLSPEHLDVWAAIARLCYEERASIVLRYVEQWSEPEIAEALECPLGTVKSRLHRAREKLARALGDDQLLEEGSE